MSFDIEQGEGNEKSNKFQLYSGLGEGQEEWGREKGGRKEIIKPGKGKVH